MKTFLSWAKTAVEEDPGVVSALRVSMIAVVGVVLVIWAACSIHAHALQEIPTNVLSLIIAHLSAKVVQKFGENKTP